MPAPKAIRPTQEERRTATRARLLEAAIACLAETGVSATTMTDVAERAGLSRGAQQYHFRTKAELMAEVARFVTQRFHQDLREAAVDLPSGPERVAAAIDVMWEAYSGPRAIAHTELWVAAKTDPDLRDALYEVERAEVPETRRLLRALFATSESPGEELDVFVDITAQFLRGLVLRGMLGKESSWIPRDLEAWKLLAAEVVPGVEDGKGPISKAWAGMAPKRR